MQSNFREKLLIPIYEKEFSKTKASEILKLLTIRNTY